MRCEVDGQPSLAALPHHPPPARGDGDGEGDECRAFVARAFYCMDGQVYVASSWKTISKRKKKKNISKRSA